MSVIDPAFGVNEFNTAKVSNESETLKNNIMTLLFMKPGSYPSIPSLGIDIQQYLYQFFDDIDTEFLKAQIAVQCQEFIPAVQGGQMQIIKTHYENKPVLLIVIPTVVDDTQTGLVIGLSADETGLISYNSQFDNSII